MKTFLILCGLLLVGGGCRQLATEVKSSPLPDMAQSVQLRTETVQQQVDVAPGSRCSVQVAYPQIDSTQDLPDDVREDMNSALERATQKMVTDNDFVSVKQAVEGYMIACSNGLKSMRSRFGEALPSVGEWTNDFSYGVKRNSDGVLSIGLSNVRYEGGAHPSTTTHYLNFDLATGQEITLLSIAVPGKEGELMAVFATALLADNRGEIFDDQADVFDGLIARPSSEDGKKMIEQYPSFFLTDATMSLDFDPYEIAPYAAGPIEVTLPLDSLKGLIRL